MNNRRCQGETCRIAATTRAVALDMPLATVLENPRHEWKKLAYGGVKVAKRVIDVDWKEFNQDNFLFSHCFVAGTKILMGDGTQKNIEDIESGDMVVSHAGNIRVVKDTMMREYSDDIMEIKVSGLPGKTRVTMEHPFFVKKAHKTCACGCGAEIPNWRKGKNFILGHQIRVFGSNKHPEYKLKISEFNKNLESFSWQKAESIQQGDSVALGFFKSAGNAVPESIAKLLGYYLSEGWVDKEYNRNCKLYGQLIGVSFAFSGDEEFTYVKDLMGLLFEVTGKKPTMEDRRPKSNCIVVRIRDVDFAKLMLKYGGTKASKKKVSPEVFQWREELQRLVFAYWYRGDAGGTISQGLAWAMKSIANACCIPSNLYERKEKKTKDGVFHQRSFYLQLRSGFMADNALEFGCLSGKSLAKTNKRIGKDVVDGRLSALVRSVKRLKTKEPILVYNFSVDEDESYVANGVVVHNCSIVCSVETEENGYSIKPCCSELVNNNGNAWTNDILLATFGTFVGGENYCFVEGTRVLMSDGTYKEIQDIKVGDRVINRKGVIDIVKNTGKRWADSLVKISSTDIMCRDLFVTEDHPFWVYHARETCPKTGRSNGFDPVKDFWQLDSWTGFSVGVHKAKGENYPCGLTPQWKNAGLIDPDRDFLTHPVSALEKQDDDVNENRAELIGWFLAEGSYSHTNNFSEEDSGVVFNLGNDEQDVAERIQSLLLAEFSQFVTRPDCQVRIEETESGSLNVRLSNREVARFFYKWCGKWAWAKKLDEKAMWLPKKIQALILKHCINGDGTGEQNSRGYSIELKSRDLIQQLLFISFRLGIKPTYRETGVLPRYTDCETVDGYDVFTEPETGKKSRPGYGLWFSVRDSMVLNKLCGHMDERIASRTKKAYSHSFSSDDGKWLVSKIGNVEKVTVGAFVYNIEVENDNSYVAEGVVVHNCEHVQIPELSKGKLLDAVIRPVKQVNDLGEANVYWVDILVATHRKHSELLKRITSGELSTMSMGCTCDYVTCSRCGKVLADNEKNCEHLDNEIRQYFTDKDGKRRIVSELCGRMILDSTGKLVADPKSVKFIEASWVERPAFTGAVLNHYISEIPKLSSIMNFNNARLAETVENMFKLRVADAHGMTVLRIARAEVMRRQKEEMVNRVARSIYGLK